MKAHCYIFAALLAAAPLAAALAQSNGPNVGATETKPADPKPAATTNTTGATGSTVAGNKAATTGEKTGSKQGSDGGGGGK
jgi:hypothetical protein